VVFQISRVLLHFEDSSLETLKNSGSNLLCDLADIHNLLLGLLGVTSETSDILERVKVLKNVE
jgi:hypothetical protein